MSGSYACDMYTCVCIYPNTTILVCYCGMGDHLVCLVCVHWCSQALIVLLGGDLNSFVSVKTLLCLHIYIYIYKVAK